MEIKGDYATSDFIQSKGIIIDLSNRCYAKYAKLFNVFNFKEPCTALPKINYILIFKTVYVKCQACSIGDFEKNATIQLSFVHGKNQKLIVHESRDMDSIMKLAKQLAIELNVRIRDSATNRRNPKWLN